MRVRYHALARQDVLSILEYYEKEVVHQAAIKFFIELEHCIRSIARRPTSFPEIAKGIRRCLLNQFPYQINYEIVGSTEIKILVVKHQRRRQNFGLDR
jgi:plasmid stabilization system protein ParE